MTLARTVLAVGLSGCTTAAALGAPPADLADLVMWAIHDDTHELVEYSFFTDLTTPVAVIRDQHGHVMDDLEALAYIPSGPGMGFYAVQNSTGCCHQKKLMRINGMDATATVFDSGPDIGYVRGMDAFQETPGEWRIYIAESFSSSPKKCRLKTVNPATQVTYDSHDIKEVGDFDGDGTTWVVMEGLALDGAGELFGVSHIGSTQSVIWRIDKSTGLAAPRGINNWRRIEAMQFAAGDATPKASDLPAAAQAWMVANPTVFDNGVLFSFADNDDEFLILNPITGEGVPAPGSFTSTDVEGLNFMNANKDPYVPVIAGCD